MSTKEFASYVGCYTSEVVETEWCGQPAFVYQNGFRAVTHDQSGWSVSTGRGTVGRGTTYQDALANEQELYDAAYLQCTGF